MKFMVSLITDESRSGRMSAQEMEQMGAQMQRFMGELQEAGALVDMGSRLGPSAAARTLRYGEDGRTVVTDGPFAESKEQTAGYMVLECSDADEAVAWAEKLPVGGAATAIEVRPIAEGRG
ncbi:MAG TPA: YciI family protein [Solirubrobacterales bacterium]|nr:YciI family protein [Solirubrobacterales bacterium]